jgi:predicted secreted protein
MASTVFNGTDLVLKFIGDGGTLEPLGHSTSCSMSITHDLPDATTKDSGGFSEVISGLRSFEISFDGLVDYTDGGNSKQNVDTILALITGRNKVDFSFGTATTGDEVISGEGFIASLEISAEMESSVTYSGSITGTGSLTVATN